VQAATDVLPVAMPVVVMPVGQGVQTVAPAADHVPAGHGTQACRPAVGAYDPAAHNAQDEPSSSGTAAKAPGKQTQVGAFTL
jgi:hypothetical protein